MRSINKLNINSPISFNSKKEDTKKTCTIERSSILFGVALIVTGIVLGALGSQLPQFSLLGGITTAVGGVVFMSASCIYCGIKLRGLGDKKKTPPTPPSSPPIPLTISTEAFFASKGVFGLPKDLIRTLDLWRRYRLGGIKLQLNPGFILHGPPGTGKTTIALHIAELLGAEFVEKAPGDLKNKFLGGSEELINEIFEVPKGHFRVILLDEISGVLGKRTDDLNKANDQRVEHFLAKLKPTDQQMPYLFIGTTNRYKELDPAVVRKGRLGGCFEIGLPNEEARRQIIRHALDKLEGEFEENSNREDLVESLVRATENSSCAEIVDYLNHLREEATIEGRQLKPSDFDTHITPFKRPEAASSEQADSLASALRALLTSPSPSLL